MGFGHNGRKETERLMFFKREKTIIQTFSGRIDALRTAGFATESVGSGRVRVTNGNLAVVLSEGEGSQAAIVDTGLMMGGEVAVLTDLGFQKIFLTPSGKKSPALAEHLQALHAFEERFSLNKVTTRPCPRGGDTPRSGHGQGNQPYACDPTERRHA